MESDEIDGPTRNSRNEMKTTQTAQNFHSFLLGDGQSRPGGRGERLLIHLYGELLDRFKKGQEKSGVADPAQFLAFLLRQYIE